VSVVRVHSRRVLSTHRPRSRAFRSGYLPTYPRPGSVGSRVGSLPIRSPASRLTAVRSLSGISTRKKGCRSSGSGSVPRTRAAVGCLDARGAELAIEQPMSRRRVVSPPRGSADGRDGKTGRHRDRSPQPAPLSASRNAVGVAFRDAGLRPWRRPRCVGRATPRRHAAQRGVAPDTCTPIHFNRDDRQLGFGSWEGA
jgi:hypothetical protein